jgi:HEAT repeat protein
MNIRTPLLLVALALFGPLTSAGAQPPRRSLLLNACAGDQSNVPYWMNALKAQDPQLRIRAAQNLGEARSAAAVPALMDALKDQNPDVRLEAERALRKINRP